VKKTPYYSSDLQHGCISPAGKALHFSYKKGNSKIKKAGKEQKSRERCVFLFFSFVSPRRSRERNTKRMNKRVNWTASIVPQKTYDPKT
jgi:hypothetical protein